MATALLALGGYMSWAIDETVGWREEVPGQLLRELTKPGFRAKRTR
jgi:hypothetical protein